MKISVELNSNTKKQKKFRVVVKPDNQQLGKIVFYTDNVQVQEIWDEARKLCGDTRSYSAQGSDGMQEDLDKKLDEIFFNLDNNF
jgi:hypothetical protein